MGRYPGVILPRYPSVTQRYVFGPFSSVYRGNGPEKTAQVPKSGVISRHIDRGRSGQASSHPPVRLAQVLAGLHSNGGAGAAARRRVITALWFL